SKNIKNFTVMGSNVNLGSRLEAYTRVAHWPIIISERSLELVKDQVNVRDLGQIQVKGFSNTVQIYGLESVVNQARLDSLSAPSWSSPVRTSPGASSTDGPES